MMTERQRFTLEVGGTSLHPTAVTTSQLLGAISYCCQIGKLTKPKIDDNQSTPPKYGIRGIPTLMLFKNGNVEATKVGAVSKSQLTAFIDSNI